MENPMELPKIPEQKRNPPREELIEPSPEEISKTLYAMFKGISKGDYEPEYYLDNGKTRFRFRDRSGKIVFDGDVGYFDKNIVDEVLRPVKNSVQKFDSGESEDKGHA